MEMSGEGSEVKDTTGREVTEDMTVGKSDSPWPEIDMEESSLIDEQTFSGDASDKSSGEQPQR